MFTLLKNVNPVLAYILVAVLLFVGVILKFFLKSLYGAFALALICYCYSYQIFGVEPMTIRELVAFISALKPEYKVGILSSLITVVGFVFAFHMSTETWRRQMKEECKFKAANELGDFFNVALGVSYKLESYAESVVGIFERLRGGAGNVDVEMHIKILLSNTKDFLEARAKMSSLAVEVHSLISRHDGALSLGWGLKKSAQHAADNLSVITEAMWFPVPIIDIDESGWFESFLSNADEQDCRNFIIVVADAQTQISGMAGGITGYLYSHIWDLNSVKLIGWLSGASKKIEILKSLSEKK